LSAHINSISLHFVSAGKLRCITEEILLHCLGKDLSLYTLTGSSYVQREVSDIQQFVKKVI
jgi:hypothetical protein